MSKKVIKLEQEFLTRASVRPESFNNENLTFDVVFSKGSKGLRTPFWDEPYFEELSMDPAHVRLERLNGGAPLLNSHRSMSLDDVIGVVENARVENGEGVATVRFDDGESNKEIVNKVRNGILKNISVGYRIHKAEILENADEKFPTMRVVDWEPLEISLVPIGFDPEAQVRSLKGSSYECEIITRDQKGADMSVENKDKNGVTTKAPESDQRAVEPQAPVAPKVDVDAERKAAADNAIKAERKRVAEISAVCRKHGMDEDFEKEAITDGLDLASVNQRILDHLATESTENETRTAHTGIETGEDLGRQARIRGMESAILYRANSGNRELIDEGQAFRYMSLLDMARECVEAAGYKTRGMPGHAIATRAFHSTSDFPLLLENTLNKSLREGYEMTPNTFEPFVRQRPMRDFKLHSSLQKGPAPKLVKKVEGGEIKRGTIEEAGEKYALGSYAVAVQVTRETIINDDLDALGSTPQDMGMQVRELELDLYWDLIINNQTMADTFGLFDAANHGNQAPAGAAPSIAEMAILRKLGRLQKDIDGKTKRNINLSHLVVSPEYETLGQQLTSQLQNQDYSPEQTANRNPFFGTSLIVEPRLQVDTGNPQPWYMFSNASRSPMAEWGVLEGQEGGPITSSYVDQATKGVIFDILYDVVFKIVEYRTHYRNPGVVI